MRAYFFSNTWLSGIQKGLQAAHVVSEMSYLACRENSSSFSVEQGKLFWDWQKNHKTIIILDGGAHGDLIEIAEFFESASHNYPWTIFCEDDYSLKGAMTCVGIILPERIYEAAKAIREQTADFILISEQWFLEGKKITWAAQPEIYTFWEVELIKLLNSRSLAR